MGAVLPATLLARTFGFQPVPLGFFAALAAMVVCYLGLIEIGKRYFYRAQAAAPLAARRPQDHHRHLCRRAARFSTTLHHRVAEVK